MSQDAQEMPGRFELTRGDAWRDWLPAAAGALAVAAAYGPLLVEHFAHLWLKPHYQYYPFALAAFAAILALRLAEAAPRNVQAADTRDPSPVVAVALGGIAWLLLAAAYYGNSPWMAAISAAVLVAAAFIQIGRTWIVPGLWGVWFLLWLVIPPPLNRDQTLITYLQRLSSKLSSWVLDALGVLHVMEGNTLQLAGKKLFVDEACSGIISVMSLIACAVIYGVWRRRSAAQVIALALSGMGWAVVTNVARIVIIAAAYDWYGIDWSAGAPHEILSLVVFTCAFLGLVSTDHLLDPLLSPVRAAWEDRTSGPMHYGRWLAMAWDACVKRDEGGSWEAVVVPQPGQTAMPQTDRWEREGAVRHALNAVRFALPNGRLVWAATALFAVLAVGQTYFWGSSSGQGGPSVAELDRVPQALALSETSLPGEVAGFKRLGFEREKRDRGNLFGDHSVVYRYEDETGQTAVASCSFPFYEQWHDLTICYAGIGWDVVEQRVLTESKESDPVENELARNGALEAMFSQPDGSSAYLVYSYFDAAGQWIEPPAQGLAAEVLKSFRKRDDVRTADQRFQVQVLLVDQQPISAERRAAARQLLAIASERFRSVICSDSPNPGDASAPTAGGAGPADGSPSAPP